LFAWRRESRQAHCSVAVVGALTSTLVKSDDLTLWKVSGWEELMGGERWTWCQQGRSGRLILHCDQARTPMKRCHDAWPATASSSASGTLVPGNFCLFVCFVLFGKLVVLHGRWGGFWALFVVGGRTRTMMRKRESVSGWGVHSDVTKGLVRFREIPLTSTEKGANPPN
jgi:hypothetical protein